MKFALIGYGKMGKAIEQVIREEYPADSIVLTIHEDNLQDLSIANLQLADVAIEFTRPDAAVEHIKLCIDAGVPIVVGTTGWMAHLPEVTAYCTAKGGGLFHSPNYSIGVNIFFEVNKRLAQLMNHQPQYEVTMEEIHHTEKLDAPSGTAIRVADIIIGELGHKSQWKLAGDSPTQPHDLLITAKREPHVPGTHTVTYRSAVDEITLTHQAVSRQGFAQGAVMAARWMAGRQGVYEMSDLLAL